MPHECQSWTVVDMTGIPDTDVDLFTDEALSDRYPLHQELRALRPAVRLTANEMYGPRSIERYGKPPTTGDSSS
jgi:hypothetical protein